MNSITAPSAAAKNPAWPSYLLSALVLGAAVYAFAPRPLPPFPATQVFADKLVLNALAQSGSRLVAVGEQGRILTADRAAGPWTEAKIEPQRGSTFTAVHAAENVLLAGGHDGWIVRSQDGGQTWTEENFDAEKPEPILGLGGPYNGKLFAVGGFGTYLTSMDQGKTWTRETITEQVDETAAAKVEAAPVSEDEDPFASFSESQSSGMADRHLNALTAAADGSLILVGERGLLARSADNGLSWKQFPEIYNGSFFGVLSLPPQGLVAYGMRGNAFYSTDLGTTWNKSEVPGGISLFGGAVNADGSIVLAGEGSTVLMSKDQGATFQVISQGERLRFASILPAGSGWLAAGEGGLREVKVQTSAGAQP